MIKPSMKSENVDFISNTYILLVLVYLPVIGMFPYCIQPGQSTFISTSFLEEQSRGYEHLLISADIFTLFIHLALFSLRHYNLIEMFILLWCAFYNLYWESEVIPLCLIHMSRLLH